MRPIKFRAWHPQQGMCNARDLRKLELSITFDGDILFGDNAVEINWRLMQYTGLLDKNGVEIYEGDILTSEDYPFQDDGQYNYHGIVEWMEGGFCRTLRLVNQDRRGISDGITESLNADNIEGVWVIGNIHEHPELLTA